MGFLLLTFSNGVLLLLFLRTDSESQCGKVINKKSVGKAGNSKNSNFPLIFYVLLSRIDFQSPSVKIIIHITGLFFGRMSGSYRWLIPPVPWVFGRICWVFGNFTWVFDISLSIFTKTIDFIDFSMEKRWVFTPKGKKSSSRLSFLLKCFKNPPVYWVFLKNWAWVFLKLEFFWLEFSSKCPKKSLT